MSGSGEEPKQSKEVEKLQETQNFKTDTYIFNGHGSALFDKNNKKTEKTFIVPPDTYYIISTKCGKKSYIASVDILTSARWRNAGLDQIPPAKGETEKVAAYKEELRQILGLDTAEYIEIFYPGDTPQDGIFSPISTIGDPKNIKKCVLDGTCGLIHRETFISGERKEKIDACKRVSLDKVEDLSCYYQFSVKPTPSDVENKTASDLLKTKYKFGDLVKEFAAKDKPAVFINPLCRVVEYEGGRRRTYRNKKLKRQTRKRR